MKNPEYNFEKVPVVKQHYEQALVPEHLTKLTIEKLPLEVAYFVEPGDRDDYEEIAIFVSPDRRLMMSKSFAIDADDAKVSSPIGRVGISRVALMNAETLKPRQVFIADLRFIEDHQLVDSDEVKDDLTDQEEFMDTIAALENAVAFDAFIALEPGEEIGSKNIPNGTYYGNPELYPYLKKLRKKSNKAMRRFGNTLMKQEDTPVVEPPAKEAPSDQAAPAEQEQTNQPSTDLSVKFSHA